MAELTADQLRLYEILMPYAFARRVDMLKTGGRFVHYTNAAAGMAILQNKEVWLRESSCMNDFMEIQHGMDCLVAAYKSSAGDHFKAAIESLSTGMRMEVERNFDGWQPHFRNDTFVSCFSEHLSSEDQLGRLSMWRAYGEESGIALVFHNAPFLRVAPGFKAYTSPIAYLDAPDFEKELDRVATNIEKSAEFLQTQPKDLMAHLLFRTLMLAAISTKHPGFAEEKEWRVIYTPKLELDENISKEVVSIGGSPQQIYKVKLRDIPSAGLTGVELPALLDRVIVGPAKYPVAICKAFVALLESAGISNARERVFYSTIPLRR